MKMLPIFLWEASSLAAPNDMKIDARQRWRRFVARIRSSQKWRTSCPWSQATLLISFPIALENQIGMNGGR